jgi:electron transport complex protein RnfE
MRLIKEFTKGFWQELPPFRLVLGLCPTLAVTTAAKNGLAMGLATTFVLVFSNLVVSSLRQVIPSKVRIASYIVIIASFVVLAELLNLGHLCSLDRGELHYPGPGRGLCL